MSPWLRCCSRQGAPGTILAIPQHCHDCLLVILAHPVLVVEVEGVTAEGAAKDVIKLVVKQALWEEQDRAGVTPPPLGSSCPSMSHVTAKPAYELPGHWGWFSSCFQDTECDQLDEHGASMVHPHLTPRGRRSPKPCHCMLLPRPAQRLRTILGEEGEHLKFSMAMLEAKPLLAHDQRAPHH